MIDSSDRPAHVAFMTPAAHGHVNPVLGLMSELVERGHRVTSAITEDFAHQVGETGATVVLHTSTLPSEQDGRQWPEDQTAALWMFLDETIAVLPQVEAAFEYDRPDVIVHDRASLQAPILGAKWGVPCLQVSPTYMVLETGGAGEVPPELLEFFTRLARLIGDEGVELSIEDLMWPPRCVATLPRSFQPGGATLPDSYAFVGPLLTEQASQEQWQPPGDLPVLLISMGSTYNDRPDFYRECVEAFAGLDWHVVMSVGRFVDPADLGELPANFEVHQWVPQVRILEHATAFLTHAGMGGVMEALYHGVPMVAVPQAADQFANAARVAELGLGKHLPREDVTAEALREALLGVTTEDGVHDRIAGIRREIHEAGGARRAAEVVEELL